MPTDFHIGEEKKPAPKGLPVAVALKAGPTAQSLPKVTASGRGLLAEQILRLAFEHGIKVREDGDLAELLALLDLDHEIPPEVIVPVAEILARVFEANARAAEGNS
ncbi:MAG TPA: EscU/YscU/HrcU family type III secretion system export apparatus switch protein [Alphaproteobacteria bacterium]|nr:EscU/YscU/HrcU family type III secretion system export apparatus switch protein [Alphaproteobacteria bacterium]